MYRVAKDVKRVLLAGVICLVLVTSNVSVAEASSTATTTQRPPCWLCW